MVGAFLVIPAPIDFFETAGLVQPMAFAAELEASNELHHSRLILSPARLTVLDGQPEPALRGIETDPGGPGCRVPGVQ